MEPIWNATNCVNATFQVGQLYHPPNPAEGIKLFSTYRGGEDFTCLGVAFPELQIKIKKETQGRREALLLTK
jgi:hypothetical protein